MTPRPAPPAPEAVAQALALVLRSMEDSGEPAGDLNGQDIEARMTHFNRLASRCQVAGEALQLAAQREAALFRRRRNALLPINRLPPELLSAILIKSVTLWERTRGSQLLAQVAWQWWQTIKSDPQFWTHISPPLRGVELQIRKAGILPLSLYWSIDMESKGRDAFKDLLERYAERWTTIVVADSDRGMDALEVLCTSPFPRLQCLSVVQSYFIMSGDCRFNLAKFQTLQEAHLQHMPSFSASPTSNSPILLQTLHLDLYHKHWHSSCDLGSLLRYTPQLIDLWVENLYDGASPPSLVDTPIISLPMLQRLRFWDVASGRRQEQDKIPLLAQIRAPLLEKFELRCRPGGWASNIGGGTVFDALVTQPHAPLNQPDNGPLLSVLRNLGLSTSWTVEVSGHEVWITAKGSGEGRLNIHCSTKDDIPKYILQPLAMFTLPVDLDMGGWDEDTELAFWDDVLDTTPSLRSFTLGCTFEVAQQVMDRLSTKAPSPSSTNPRAPLLEKVRFQHELHGLDLWRGDDVGEAVKTMLESRRNLLIHGGVLDPPKLVVTEPYGFVFDEVDSRWVDSDDAQCQS